MAIMFNPCQPCCGCLVSVLVILPFSKGQGSSIYYSGSLPDFNVKIINPDTNQVLVNGNQSNLSPYPSSLGFFVFNDNGSSNYNVELTTVGNTYKYNLPFPSTYALRADGTEGILPGGTRICIPKPFVVNPTGYAKSGYWYLYPNLTNGSPSQLNCTFDSVTYPDFTRPSVSTTLTWNSSLGVWISDCFQYTIQGQSGGFGGSLKPKNIIQKIAVYSPLNNIVRVTSIMSDADYSTCSVFDTWNPVPSNVYKNYIHDFYYQPLTFGFTVTSQQININLQFSDTFNVSELYNMTGTITG